MSERSYHGAAYSCVGYRYRKRRLDLNSVLPIRKVHRTLQTVDYIFCTVSSGLQSPSVTTTLLCPSKTIVDGHATQNACINIVVRISLFVVFFLFLSRFFVLGVYGRKEGNV